MQEVSFNCKLRVLVVETDPARRTALVENLKQRPFEIFCAEGEGAKLLEDAQDKVLQHHCHVVVIAPRLFDPANPAGMSGLEVAEHLIPARAVIYAMEADDQVAFEAGRRGMVYFRHDRPISELLMAVEAQGRRFCNCTLRVSWPQSEFHYHVAASLKNTPEEITEDQLYDLVGQLFPEALRLELRLLPSLETTSLNESPDVQVPVRRAVVVWARESREYTDLRRTPKVVKIGSRDQVQQEVNNYRRYVDGWLSQERQAHLENHQLQWRLGAIIYTFLGASPEQLQIFRRFYHRHEASQIVRALYSLFTNTARNWYQGDRRTLKDYRLFDLYELPLKINKRLERLDTSSDHLTFPGVPGILPNPGVWALYEGKRTIFDEVTTCISHGDLHGDNFFIDQGKLAWLIDFEQTGPTHALRDFVELEADIKLRLTAYPDDDLRPMTALERALQANRSLTGMYTPTHELIALPAQHKAFQVIAGLRHLAAIATGITNVQEYLHALLYETIFMATLSRLSPTIRQRALLSAALIVESMKWRTGLLSRQPAIQRLDLTALQQMPEGKAEEELKAHRAYLQACYQAALLQRMLYNGQAPVDLEKGLELITQEAWRISPHPEE